jgi:hypothetical protein
VDYEITWGGPVEDVLIRTVGQSSLEGFEGFLDECLSDSRWRPAMRVLFDQRAVDMSALTSGDLQQRVDILLRERGRLAAAHVALVLARAVEFGLHRMMESYSDDWRGGEVMDLALFYTVDEARAWLSQFPGPTA